MTSLHIGEREPANAHRGGKRILQGATRPLSPSRLVRAKGRDTLIEEELKAIRDGLNGRDQFICIDTLREMKKPEGRAHNVHRPDDHDLFGPPVQDKIPPRRIRPTYNEEDLQPLTARDNRKTDAVDAIQSAPDMLTKMYNCEWPVPRPASPPKPRKRSFHKPTGVVEDTPVAPAGFRGLGAHCPPEHRRGMALKKDEHFEIDLKALAQQTPRLRKPKEITAPIH